MTTHLLPSKSIQVIGGSKQVCGSSKHGALRERCAGAPDPGRLPGGGGPEVSMEG